MLSVHPLPPDVHPVPPSHPILSVVPPVYHVHNVYSYPSHHVPSTVPPVHSMPLAVHSVRPVHLVPSTVPPVHPMTPLCIMRILCIPYRRLCLLYVPPVHSSIRALWPRSVYSPYSPRIASCDSERRSTIILRNDVEAGLVRVPAP